MLATTLLTLSGLASFGAAQYTLQDDYSTDEFFSMFDFFTDADPTAGYVTYVDQSTASSASLISTGSDTVHIGVDSTNVASGSGRESVRITSKNSYDTGLVILDLEHMPGSICGTWPAFWMVGPNWPTNGEVDIIEGVNTQVGNAMTLHTGPDCSISNTTASFSGSIETSNCYVDATGQADNAGCGITTALSSSYGDGFNAVDGGVYATDITSAGISIWFFPRADIPSDISSGSPDPTGWGEATASFSGSCDFSSSFQDLQIVFDVTFCGDWAGEVWSSDATCAAYASTCVDYVQNNPSAFADSYWTINSLKVYSADDSSSSSTTTTTTSDVVETSSDSESVSVSVSSASESSVSTPASSSTVSIATESSSTSTATETASTTSAAYGGFGPGNGGNGAPTETQVNDAKALVAPASTAVETTSTAAADKRDMIVADDAAAAKIHRHMHAHSSKRQSHHGRRRALMA